MGRAVNFPGQFDRKGLDVPVDLDGFEGVIVTISSKSSGRDIWLVPGPSRRGRRGRTTARGPPRRAGGLNAVSAGGYESTNLLHLVCGVAKPARCRCFTIAWGRQCVVRPRRGRLLATERERGLRYVFLRPEGLRPTPTRRWRLPCRAARLSFLAALFTPGGAASSPNGRQTGAPVTAVGDEAYAGSPRDGGGRGSTSASAARRGGDGGAAVGGAFHRKHGT